MAAEHGELVAEHQDLQVFGGVTAGERREGLDRTAQREIVLQPVRPEIRR
jgi:hypothetical protein